MIHFFNYLLIISIILIVTGIVASFVPIIPGPITGWFGLFALSQIHDFYVSNTLLIITFIVAITIFFPRLNFFKDSNFIALKFVKIFINVLPSE